MPVLSQVSFPKPVDGIAMKFLYWDLHYKKRYVAFEVMKVFKESRGIAPLILNLGIRR